MNKSAISKSFWAAFMILCSGAGFYAGDMLRPAKIAFVKEWVPDYRDYGTLDLTCLSSSDATKQINEVARQRGYEFLWECIPYVGMLTGFLGGGLFLFIDAANTRKERLN